MRCGVELRRQEVKYEEWKVKYYKCGKEEHKCKEYPLWKRKKRVVRVAKLQKAY